MPEPLLYLKAMGAAAIVSAIVVLMMAMAKVRRPAKPGNLPADSTSKSHLNFPSDLIETTSTVSTQYATATRLNLACVLGIGFGLAVGYYLLSMRFVWPPQSALDRFLTLIVPAALTIELIAGWKRVPRSVAWLLRLTLVATIPRILLHKSVYLSGSEGDWKLWQAVMLLVICSALLASLWSLLSWLQQRRPGDSIPLSLCLSIQVAGLTVMMAGYIKGGAAAFPLVGSILATTIATRLFAKRLGVAKGVYAPALLSIGVIGLFGLLFIGHYFGRLSTGSALTILLAPLLCWVTEIPLARHRNPWIVGTIRLVIVAVPLLVVLILAKRDFDRDLAPLL